MFENIRELKGIILNLTEKNYKTYKIKVMDQNHENVPQDTIFNPFLIQNHC